MSITHVSFQIKNIPEREMVMKRKNEDEEELDVSKAAKLDPPPEEVIDISPSRNLETLEKS